MYLLWKRTVVVFDENTLSPKRRSRSLYKYSFGMICALHYGDWRRGGEGHIYAEMWLRMLVTMGGLVQVK